MTGHRCLVSACAVATLLPGAAALASVPARPSVEGLLLYGAVTALFLLVVPLTAASGALARVARGVLAAVLPRIRFCHADGPPAGALETAAGVFGGPRGLGGFLDDLRNRLARRGPPGVGREI